MNSRTVEFPWTALENGIPVASPASESIFTATQPAPEPAVVILGVPLDPVTRTEAVTRIEQMIASRRPHHLITANLDFLVQASHDVELRRIFLEASLVLCDGTPLVWASRLLGNPLPERVAGADLVPELLRTAAKKHYRPFFLGGAPDVAAQAVANLRERFPGLDVAGYYSPAVRPLLEMDHEEIRRCIQAARPDLLFVSFGCPKAEKWIAMHYRSLGVPVTIGVGATIDFLAGRVKRAPLWMQQSGTEWIFRLMQEPRRLCKRYAADFWHLCRELPPQWWRLQRRGARAAGLSTQAVVVAERHWLRLKMPERLDYRTVRSGQNIWERISGRHSLLELDEVKFIDSTGVGLLVRLWRRLRAAQCELVLIAPSPVVRHALRLLRLEEIFTIAPDVSEARQWIATRRRSSPDRSTEKAFSGLTQPWHWPGEITASNAAEFWKTIRDQFARLSGQQSSLLVDLSELRFIDSTGIGLLVRAKKEAERHSIRLCFTSVRGPVRNIIRLAQLDAFLLGGVA